MNEPVIPEITFHEPDPETNLQTVTVKIPNESPEVIKQMFFNAIWGLRDLDTTKGESK
jgi:hypothetical protein